MGNIINNEKFEIHERETKEYNDVIIESQPIYKDAFDNYYNVYHRY